jgi:hypothetical protein
MATLQQQIKDLEKEASVTKELRDEAVSNGRLTKFGKDFVHACANNDISPTLAAKLLGVTTSAVVQNYNKLKS